MKESTTPEPVHRRSDEDVPEFLHPATELRERVQMPAFLGAGAFRALWLGLAGLVSTLLWLGSTVAGRIA